MATPYHASFDPRAVLNAFHYNKGKLPVEIQNTLREIVALARTDTETKRTLQLLLNDEEWISGTDSARVLARMRAARRLVIMIQDKLKIPEDQMNTLWTCIGSDCHNEDGMAPWEFVIDPTMNTVSEFMFQVPLNAVTEGTDTPWWARPYSYGVPVIDPAYSDLKSEPMKGYRFWDVGADKFINGEDVSDMEYRYPSGKDGSLPDPAQRVLRYGVVDRAARAQAQLAITPFGDPMLYPMSDFLVGLMICPSIPVMKMWRALSCEGGGAGQHALAYHLLQKQIYYQGSHVLETPYPELITQMGLRLCTSMFDVLGGGLETNPYNQYDVLHYIRPGTAQSGSRDYKTQLTRGVCRLIWGLSRMLGYVHHIGSAGRLKKPLFTSDKLDNNKIWKPVIEFAIGTPGDALTRGYYWLTDATLIPDEVSWPAVYGFTDVKEPSAEGPFSYTSLEYEGAPEAVFSGNAAVPNAQILSWLSTDIRTRAIFADLDQRLAKRDTRFYDAYARQAKGLPSVDDTWLMDTSRPLLVPVTPADVREVNMLLDMKETRRLLIMDRFMRILGKRTHVPPLLADAYWDWSIVNSLQFWQGKEKDTQLYKLDDFKSENPDATNVMALTLGCIPLDAQKELFKTTTGDVPPYLTKYGDFLKTAAFFSLASAPLPDRELRTSIFLATWRELLYCILTERAFISQLYPRATPPEFTHLRYKKNKETDPLPVTVLEVSKDPIFQTVQKNAYTHYVQEALSYLNEHQKHRPAFKTGDTAQFHITPGQPEQPSDPITPDPSQPDTQMTVEQAIEGFKKIAPSAAEALPSQVAQASGAISRVIDNIDQPKLYDRLMELLQAAAKAMSVPLDWLTDHKEEIRKELPQTVEKISNTSDGAVAVLGEQATTVAIFKRTKETYQAAVNALKEIWHAISALAELPSAVYASAVQTTQNMYSYAHRALGFLSTESRYALPSSASEVDFAVLNAIHGAIDNAQAVATQLFFYLYGHVIADTPLSPADAKDLPKFPEGGVVPTGWFADMPSLTEKFRTAMVAVQTGFTALKKSTTDKLTVIQRVFNPSADDKIKIPKLAEAANPGLFIKANEVRELLDEATVKTEELQKRTDNLLPIMGATGKLAGQPLREHPVIPKGGLSPLYLLPLLGIPLGMFLYRSSGMRKRKR
jgi:hypothetical protein